jgi:two-component system, cell cycle response regulator
MNTKRTYRVAMLGLPEAEQRILKSIARISAGRPSGYEFVEIEAGRRNDVVIIDGDSPESLQAWRSLRLDEPAIFFVTREIAGQDCLKRPVMGARLLGMLDGMVARGDSRAAHTASTNAPAVPSAAGTAAPRSRLALVVDDSPTVRTHIQQGLAPFGLNVDFAETGEQALELLAGRTYDIVFLDVVLPGIDGYAVCKSIKKARDTKATPVIMLTGKSSTFDRIKGSLAGCDTYLTKPVEYQVFHDTVRKYLDAGQDAAPTAR